LQPRNWIKKERRDNNETPSRGGDPIIWKRSFLHRRGITKVAFAHKGGANKETGSKAREFFQSGQEKFTQKDRDCCQHINPSSLRKMINTNSR